MIFPDFSLTFSVCSKFPDFSQTRKCLPIFPVRVGTLVTLRLHYKISFLLPHRFQKHFKIHELFLLYQELHNQCLVYTKTFRFTQNIYHKILDAHPTSRPDFLHFPFGVGATPSRKYCIRHQTQVR